VSDVGVAKEKLDEKGYNSLHINNEGTKIMAAGTDSLIQVYDANDLSEPPELY
jgi:hypothetical protein